MATLHRRARIGRTTRSRTAALGVGLLLVIVGCTGGTVEQSVDQTAETSAENGMRLTSNAFEHEGDIPRRFTCDGLDASPPLTVSEIPPDAVSLALVMDDPDAPGAVWDHWVAYDIPITTEIPEGVDPLGTPGKNSWGRTGYGGPCPPSGIHRYVFSVYALDTTNLGIGPGATKREVLDAVEGHVVAEAELMGRYSR